MSNPFVFGGSLPSDAPTYLHRSADHEIFQALSTGIYCYLLNSRQTGKSSLGVSTFNRLTKQGHLGIWVDLSLQDTTHSHPDQWYLNLLDLINFEAGFTLDADAWWERYPHRSGLNRFQKYIDTVLLTDIAQPIVIFIDEIDSVLSLSFAMDDFFAYIRSCYNKRTIDSRYQQLTFCLMGVTSPNALIQDSQRTPFNIGKRISLTGFQLEETKPLQHIFAGKIPSPQGLLADILTWTGGQPFLTQKLCSMAYDALESKSFSALDTLVRRKILNRWEIHDDPQHLLTIQKRLTLDDEVKGRRLELLETLHHQNSIPLNGSAAEVTLLLSGIAIEINHGIQIYNPIYRQIFSLEWLKQELSHFRPYHMAIAAWIASNHSEQYLLDSEQLKTAQSWSQQRSLSETDYLFLNASQEAARSKAIQAERKAIQTAELAITNEQKALKNYQNSRTVLWISLACSGLILAIASTLGIMATRRFQNVNLRDKLNQGSAYAWREFEAQREVDGLLIALETGIELRKSAPQPAKFGDYLTIVPIKTLNRIKDQMREYRFSHPDLIIHAAFSPNGRQLVTSGNDRTAKLWDTSGQLRQIFQGHQGEVLGVTFNSTGDRLMTGAADATAKQWRLDGTLEQTFTGYPKRVQTVDLSPDGQTLLVGAFGRGFWLRQISTSSLQRISAHPKRVRHVVFDPTGRFILTSAEDNTAALWTSQGTKIRSFVGHDDFVTHGAFSANGQTILTTSADKSAILWDLNGQRLHRFWGHFGWVESGDISPDGQSILTSSRDRTVKHWRTDGELIAEYTGFKGRVRQALFSPNGQQILTISQDQTASLWDIEEPSNPPFFTQTQPLRMADYHPDGASVVVTSNQEAFHLITQLGESIREFEGHTGSVWTARFNREGTQIITASADQTARLWNSSGQLLTTFTGHQDAVLDAVISPDGQTVLTASKDNTATLWTIQGKKLQSFRGHRDDVWSVRFSPDGQSVLTSSLDHSARLWNLNGELLQVFEGHTALVRTAVFNAKGDRILTASDDQTANLWSLDGNSIQGFIGHGDRLQSAEFSPDGESILTASNDRTARLWDLKGNELQVFKAHRGSVQDATFNPQGTEIVTVSDDKTARRWEVRTLESLLQWGCDRVKSYLDFNDDISPKYQKLCDTL